MLLCLEVSAQVSGLHLPSLQTPAHGLMCARIGCCGSGAQRSLSWEPPERTQQVVSRWPVAVSGWQICDALACMRIQESADA